MKIFSIEFTPIDRLNFQIRIQNNQLTGLRAKVQTYKMSQRVITDVRGYEPFNVGDWLSVVKYDNFKGEAIRDAMRETPVSFSPIGLHMKEKWGYLDVYQLLEKVLIDVRDNWHKDYINFGGSIPPMTEERLELKSRNFPFVMQLATYILHDRTILEQLRDEQSIMPMPKPGQDDWLIDENTNAMTRLEKMALRGKLSIEPLGQFDIITHRPRAEGEDTMDSPVI